MAGDRHAIRQADTSRIAVQLPFLCLPPIDSTPENLYHREGRLRVMLILEPPSGTNYIDPRGRESTKPVQPVSSSNSRWAAIHSGSSGSWLPLGKTHNLLWLLRTSSTCIWLSCQRKQIAPAFMGRV